MASFQPKRRDPLRLAEAISAGGVTRLTVVPSLLNALLVRACAALAVSALRGFERRGADGGHRCGIPLAACRPRV